MVKLLKASAFLNGSDTIRLSDCTLLSYCLWSEMDQMEAAEEMDIAAFSGDNVYWEIPDDLPKMTKLMVDGKALYIHRANYQIIDKDLI